MVLIHFPLRISTKKVILQCCVFRQPLTKILRLIGLDDVFFLISMISVINPPPLPQFNVVVVCSVWGDLCTPVPANGKQNNLLLT